MAEINLIPSDLIPSQEGLKATQSIKRLIVMAVAVFILVTGIGIAVIIILSNNVNASLAREASLTQSITSLEGTEQKIFLVKDRVSKIQSIESTTDAADAVKMLKNIIFNLPNKVFVNTIETDGSTTKLSVISKDSLGMAVFLNTMVASSIYKKVILTSFSFSPEIGYTVALEGS